MLTLADAVEGNGVNASCRHGMLEATLPLKEDVKAGNTQIATAFAAAAARCAPIDPHS
jgi:hypothetical protein